MKNILETTQLEFDKSAFLIDLVKHNNGSVYVDIVQSINESNQDDSSIKINSSVLTDLIKVLQNYQAKIPTRSESDYKHVTDSIQQKIQERYLKGVPIKDLAMQFDQSPELIELTLRNRGIKIVDNKIPKPRYWKRRKR